jgi:hypothetical protein
LVIIPLGKLSKSLKFNGAEPYIRLVELSVELTPTKRPMDGDNSKIEKPVKVNIQFVWGGVGRHRKQVSLNKIINLFFVQKKTKKNEPVSTNESEKVTVPTPTPTPSPEPAKEEKKEEKKAKSKGGETSEGLSGWQLKCVTTVITVLMSVALNEKESEHIREVRAPALCGVMWEMLNISKRMRESKEVVNKSIGKLAKVVTKVSKTILEDLNESTEQAFTRYDKRAATRHIANNPEHVQHHEGSTKE